MDVMSLSARGGLETRLPFSRTQYVPDLRGGEPLLDRVRQLDDRIVALADADEVDEGIVVHHRGRVERRVDASQDDRDVEIFLDLAQQYAGLRVVVRPCRHGHEIGPVVLDVADDPVGLERVVEPLGDVQDPCVVAGGLEGAREVCLANADAQRAVEVRPNKLDSHLRNSLLSPD